MGPDNGETSLGSKPADHRFRVAAFDDAPKFQVRVLGGDPGNGDS